MSARKATTIAATAAGLVGSMLALQASACSVTDFAFGSSAAQASAFAQFSAGMKTAGQTVRTGSLPGSAALSANANSSIVGLWRFAFIASDQSAIDWGFQTWHRDGTEITNSGSRPPKNGNFCMGVWKQLPGGQFSLNHWAIAWGNPPDFDASTLSGLVNIRETVSIDRSGDSMSGTVSLDLYDLRRDDEAQPSGRWFGRSNAHHAVARPCGGGAIQAAAIRRHHSTPGSPNARKSGLSSDSFVL